MRESGPRKRDEDGDDDGDVDEDDHRGDDSPPDDTLMPPRDRRRGSPPCTPSSGPWPSWRWWPLRNPPPWPPVMMAPSGRVPERA